jgi:hypothetical protein
MNAFLSRFPFVFLAFSQLASGDVIEPLAQKWVTRYSVPGAFDTMPAAIAVDASGDVFVASFVEVATNTFLAAVSKLAGTTGTPLWRWQSTFYVDSGDIITPSAPCRLAVGPDANPVAAFSSRAVKLLGADGSQLWITNSSTSYPSGFYELALDPLGNVLLVGALSGGMLWKFDRQTGLPLWDRQVNGTVMLRAVQADADGNICVAGETSAWAGHPCTAKLSPDGTILWSTIETDAAEAGRARLLVLDPAGNPIVATYQGRLLKYRGSDGLRQWSAAGLTSPWDLVLDAAGDIYLSDQSSDVARYSGETGVRVWQTPGNYSLKKNLLVYGNQLLTYGSSGSLGLTGVEPQTGITRWYQLYFGSSAAASNGSRAVKLMALQPDGGIVVAGTARNPWGYFENVVLKYGTGPSVTNAGADWVLPTRAQLKSTATGNFAPSEIYWEYGPTTSYGNSTPRQSIIESWVWPAPFYSATIEGLAENTLYHARAVAISARGTTVTADFTFTTGWDANRNKLPDEWELQKWGNTSTHDAISDDDKDGTSNLLEYALDRHPRLSDAGVVPPVTIDTDGHLSMTVVKRPHVTLRVEASTDLLTWVPAVVVVENDTTFTAREEFPPSTPGGRFLRLRVTSE